MSEHSVAPRSSSRSKWRCKCLEVKRCCFCISLLHGAYIIGGLQCFGGLLTLCVTIHVSRGATAMTTGLIFELICDAILTATAALLLLGALWRRAILVLIWIICVMAFVVFTVINLTTLFFAEGFSMRFHSMIVAVLGCYFSICMFSFYRKLARHELEKDDNFNEDPYHVHTVPEDL